MNLFSKSFLAIAMLVLISSISVAQYSNGPLSTGATATGGAAAPAGTTWSEVQGTNINAGFGASIAGGLTLADNFTVPAGQTWNVTKFTFYAYSTGYASTTVSPFNDTRVQIFNTNPSVGTPTPIFGNLTTNRFAGSTNASMYRIFNATPGTTRIIWKIDATVVTALPAGTYWVEWQHGVTAGLTSNFSPAKTVVGVNNQPGDNAQQHTLSPSSWAAVVDGTNPQDMPFDISYTASGTACTGTPTPGNTLSTISSGCPGANFTLSLSSPPSTLGITYQWQISPTGAAGSYTNIAGATASTYANTVTTGGFYQCLVTCSGSTGTSTPKQITVNPPSACYCTPTPYTSGCGFSDVITNVTFGGINNNSGCSTTPVNGYANYTGTVTAGNILSNAANPISVTVGPGGTEYVGVWIDYNQSGSFDPSEFTALGTGNGSTINGFINIPASALSGNTRMRVKVNWNAAIVNTSACTGQTYGEIEDYTVNIQPCTPATFTANPAATTSAVCGGSATISVSASGSLPTYSWQYRTSSTGVWITVPASAPYSGTTTATLTINPINSSFAGYQYRALLTGGCSAVDFSSPSTIAVTPIAVSVTPTSATICAGGIQQLKINNVASPAAGSVTVNSTFTTPITIPDAGGTSPFPVVNPTVLAGINTTLPVTVPAGATVTGVSVRVSGTHTYFGDLVMSLKAPNGSIVNLDYFLNATGGGVSTAFTNTVISSTGTAALSTGTAAGLYTGTFKADLIAAAGTAPFGNTPAGPTGFIPTVTSWTPLITPTTSANASGNWTLAIFDGGGGDIGTLNNWSITINYLIGPPGTGIFAGPAGTIFTDAAATIPYNGTTPVNTVYVKPTTAGVNNYTLTYTDGPCTSPVVTIPVTVNTPAAGTLSVANNTNCAGTNSTFSFTGLTAGTGLTYQWQVSTDNGVTYTNVSGATASTLALNGVSTTMNGNKYRVIVSSTGCTGSLTSSAGTLTVNPTPVVTISAAPIVNLFPGLTTTLTAAVSPNAAASYKWYRNGVEVTGATANKYIVTIDTKGTYNVAVTDVNGCSANAGLSTPTSIAIGDSANTNQLFIYPSPNNGTFQVRYYTNTTDGSAIPGGVSIYDERGAKVFSQTYSVGAGYQAMNVVLPANLARGIYRVDLVDTNGGRIKTGSVFIFR